MQQPVQRNLKLPREICIFVYFLFQVICIGRRRHTYIHILHALCIVFPKYMNKTNGRAIYQIKVKLGIFCVLYSFIQHLINTTDNKQLNKIYNT